VISTTCRSTSARGRRRSPDRLPAVRPGLVGAPDSTLATYRLTVRHGSRVRREGFDDLDEAIAAMEQRAATVRAEGPLSTAKAIRDYGPETRVAARLELSAGGWLRGREAGLDVMGDGELIPYRGVIFKQRLEPRGGQSAFDAVREAIG
jgi:hypothetical protein